MSSPRDIVFIGSSGIGLQRLSESQYFTVVDVLCPTKRMTSKLKLAAEKLGRQVRTFDWIRDFKPLITRFDTAMPFFIYQLDMLVPASLTAEYRFYNLHRGNLMTNRGPNPDIWPFLNGDKTTAMSLHQINEKIDSGILIDSYEVEILDSDDTSSVRAKLEEGLSTLIESLHRHLEGLLPGSELAGGTYYPWVTEKDFTIDLENDSLDLISRKIRSQRVYNGAILYQGGNKYYINELRIAGIYEKPKGSDTLMAKVEGRRVCLVINPDPKYPPPPVFPPAKRI